MTPEALDNGVLARVETGDMIIIDGEQGQLELLVSEDELSLRRAAVMSSDGLYYGTGRELFGSLRTQFTGAEQGACSLFQGRESAYEA